MKGHINAIFFSLLKMEARGFNCEFPMFQNKNNSEQGIFGKESTPFLLKRVNELTGGHSLKSSM